MGKPSGFTRDTTECLFAGLPRGMADAIRRFAEREGLADPAGQSPRCFVVTSAKKGFFGGTHTQLMGFALAPGWLLFSGCEDKGDPWARGMRLADIVAIRDYEQTEAFSLVEDHGIEIHGTLFGDSRRSTWFIGLGSGAASDAFRKALRGAVGE